MFCSVHDRENVLLWRKLTAPATDNYYGVLDMTVIQVLFSVSVVAFSFSSPQVEGTDNQAKLTTPPVLSKRNGSGASLSPALQSLLVSAVFQQGGCLGAQLHNTASQQ